MYFSADENTIMSWFTPVLSLRLILWAGGRKTLLHFHDILPSGFHPLLQILMCETNIHNQIAP